MHGCIAKQCCLTLRQCRFLRSIYEQYIIRRLPLDMVSAADVCLRAFGGVLWELGDQFNYRTAYTWNMTSSYILRACSLSPPMYLAFASANSRAA